MSGTALTQTDRLTLPSVLIIDDEVDNFDVIDTLLCHENYQLHYAASGLDALQLLPTFQPDVILLDVMMPHMSGLDLCHRLKTDSQWQHIPIIMVTSLNSKQDLARCLDAGADDFIAKPVNSRELRARLRSMLRIKQQYDNLQGLLQMREDMVKMVIHDLRNPLASILLAAEILSYPNLPPEKQQKKIQQILSCSQDLKTLIDDLLLMAKLELGKLTLQRQPVDLTLFCENTLTGIADIAAQKHLQLNAHLPPPGGAPVQIDATLCRRVLENLLMNAIKFSPEYSAITLSATYRARGGFSMSVVDQGPGVSPTLRQHIFEKYEIGSLMPGTSQIGLGLAFCKIAVEAHGGTIAVTDNAPKGTVFTVEIP
jgi:two-component system, sensor histidine kinase and response regulator